MRAPGVGAGIPLPIRGEAFGQRHFLVGDPNSL